MFSVSTWSRRLQGRNISYWLLLPRYLAWCQIQSGTQFFLPLKKGKKSLCAFVKRQKLTGRQQESSFAVLSMPYQWLKGSKTNALLSGSLCSVATERINMQYCLFSFPRKWFPESPHSPCSLYLSVMSLSSFAGSYFCLYPDINISQVSVVMSLLPPMDISSNLTCWTVPQIVSTQTLHQLPAV